MLSELYEKLGVGGEIDPDFIKSAIFSDNLWGIPRKYAGIPFDDSDDPPIVKEVLDILEMWRSIDRSYKRLSDGEKRKLEEAADPYGKESIFPGFDGNNESSYRGTALFIVNDLERFEELKGRDLNSHCPSIGAYKRMLPVYTNICQAHGYEMLSVDHLAAILTEMDASE